MARTAIILTDHFNAVLDRIIAHVAGAFPVGEWERPEDVSERFQSPPFAYVRIYPSADEFDGPISDTQADIQMRFQVMAAGLTAQQALTVTDICHQGLLDRRLITIPNRRVMNLKRMVVAGGQTRGEDIPDPYHFSMDLYTMKTTPA